MVQFLDNTIYTNYALNKICENLVEDISNFNFIKVKVGSGDNTLYEDRIDLSAPLYSLVIQELNYNQNTGVLTIICELPPELAEVPITEIGLFDTVLGTDHLFSYSKVNIVKPADIGYELTIVLNLGPRTIDFPGKNEFLIPSETYATKDTLYNLSDTLIYVTTNLERAIRSNAGEIGLNLPEVSYMYQSQLNRYIRNINYASIFYSFNTMFGNLLKDMFFIHEPNYITYNICNLANNESFLDTYYKLWSSSKDSITFHQGPVSLLFMAKFSDLNIESTIINKKSNTELYFSIDIKKNYEPYLLYSEPGNGNVYQYALFNELVITFYGLSDIYEIKYIFDMANKGDYINQVMPYTLTFNGDFNYPDFHFYFNGKEPELYIPPTSVEDSLYVQAGILESDSEEEKTAKLSKTEEILKSRLYGKLIVNSNKNILSNMPDYSYLPLRNHLINYDSNQSYNYENALGITELLTIKKQVNKYELAFLNNILKQFEIN